MQRRNRVIPRKVVSMSERFAQYGAICINAADVVGSGDAEPDEFYDAIRSGADQLRAECKADQPWKALLVADDVVATLFALFAKRHKLQRAAKARNPDRPVIAADEATRLIAACVMGSIEVYSSGDAQRVDGAQRMQQLFDTPPPEAPFTDVRFSEAMHAAADRSEDHAEGEEGNKNT